MELWSVVRWVRAASFSAACAVLAAAGHAFGGGQVDGAALMLGLALVFVPALVLTGRERTLGSIVPAVAAAQVVMHTLLPEGSAAVPDAAAFQHAPHTSSPTLGMLLMHAVAVLITAWWLECGESALCSLVRHLAGWMPWPLRLDISAPVPEFVRLLPALRERWGLQLAALRHIVDRRGPPLGQVALG